MVFYNVDMAIETQFFVVYVHSAQMHKLSETY